MSRIWSDLSFVAPTNHFSLRSKTPFGGLTKKSVTWRNNRGEIPSCTSQAELSSRSSIHPNSVGILVILWEGGHVACWRSNLQRVIRFAVDQVESCFPTFHEDLQSQGAFNLEHKTIHTLKHGKHSTHTHTHATRVSCSIKERIKIIKRVKEIMRRAYWHHHLPYHTVFSQGHFGRYWV